MKKIKANKFEQHKVLLAIIIMALVVAVVGSAVWWTTQSNSETSLIDNGIEVTPAPESLSEEDAANKKAFIESQEKGADSNTTKEGSASDQESSDVNIEARQSGDSVVITTQLQKIGDGTCSLEVSSGGRSHNETVDVIYQPSYSSCAGFSVPVNKLRNGTWQITVSATSLSNSTATASTTLEVN